VGEKCLDFRRAHFTRVTLVMEEDKALDPFSIGVFGAVGIMFEADGIADLIEDFFALWLRSNVWHVDLMRSEGI
jgi:hypothetical protein